MILKSRTPTRLRNVLLASAASLGLALPARADLISIDLNTPGDGLITRDTVHNLDWLNLNLTKNLSYNQLFAGAGGWYAQGWRHASIRELCSLFANYLGDLSRCDQFFRVEVSIDKGASFQSNLGETGTIDFSSVSLGVSVDSGELVASWAV